LDLGEVGEGHDRHSIVLGVFEGTQASRFGVPIGSVIVGVNETIVSDHLSTLRLIGQAKAMMDPRGTFSLTFQYLTPSHPNDDFIVSSSYGDQVLSLTPTDVKEASSIGGDHSDGVWPRWGRPATLEGNAVTGSSDSEVDDFLSGHVNDIGAIEECHDRSAGKVVIATTQVTGP
jgi:hypothetical protein